MTHFIDARNELSLGDARELLRSKIARHLVHIVRNLSEREAKLQTTMEQYERATEMLKGHRALMVKTLLLNMAHRVAQIMVTVFCFLAGGGSLKLAPKLFAMQSDVVIGSCCIPIPGSMGVTDYLMIDGFSSMMTEQQSANLELLARATSFYICILLCGIIVLIKCAVLKFRKNEQAAAVSGAVEAETVSTVEAEAAKVIEAETAKVIEAETVNAVAEETAEIIEAETGTS